jgi:hypothetical protein
MDLCRDTSRILNTEAPRRAALVRNPARRGWAPKSVAKTMGIYRIQRRVMVPAADHQSLLTGG